MSTGLTAARALLWLALILPGPAIAAGFTCEQPASLNVPPSGNGSQTEELDEVLVTAGKSTDSTSDLRAWLRRLVGQYTYEGYVDLCGKGRVADQRAVSGKADCIGFSASPSVQCQLNVRWPEEQATNGVPIPGGVSTLDPAMVVYGLEAHHWGIRLMQVDNKGVAEAALGMLIGDTLVSREPCVDNPVHCRKTMRITASPDSNEIAMLVDVEINNARALRYAFVMRRTSNVQKVEQYGVASP